jgi:hypothetical protein
VDIAADRDWCGGDNGYVGINTHVGTDANVLQPMDVAVFVDFHIVANVIHAGCPKFMFVVVPLLK